MDTKVQEVLSPLSYRLIQLVGHHNTLPVLVALGVVLVSYVIYNVRQTMGTECDMMTDIQ